MANVTDTLQKFQWTYGNYGGRGWVGGRWVTSDAPLTQNDLLVPPADAVDTAYQRHDKNDLSTNSLEHQLKVNADLITDLKAAILDPDVPIVGKILAYPLDAHTH